MSINKKAFCESCPKLKTNRVAYCNLRDKLIHQIDKEGCIDHPDYMKTYDIELDDLECPSCKKLLMRTEDIVVKNEKVVVVKIYFTCATVGCPVNTLSLV